MKYKVKSIIVCRKKDPKTNEDFPYLVEVKLFNINDPHKTAEVPFRTLEFLNVMSVSIKNHEVRYYPRGSDIILNDLIKVDVKKLKSSNHEGYKVVIE